MPLYDVTYGNPRLINPTRTTGGFVDALKRKLPSVTFNKLIKTVDEALEDAVTNKKSLVWVSAGSLFGYKSKRPMCDVDHLWTKIISIVGVGAECRKAVGGMLRWRVAERGETYWLLYVQDRETYDPITGELITISEYWINEEFIPPQKPIKKKTTLQELASKFSSNK